MSSATQYAGGADNDDAWQVIGAQAKAVKEAINVATGDPAKFC
jgi:hypothetical protein